MGKLFEQFLAERKNWRSFDKFEALSDLLACALRELDVNGEDVLSTLVALVGTPIDVGPDSYRVVAEMREPGWLAAAGRKSAKAASAAKRQEGARWIRYGRKPGEVAPDDIAAIERLLSDKVADVRSTAISALAGMLPDDAEATLALLRKWSKRLKGADRVFAAVALTSIWGTAGEDQTFVMQLDLLRDPKTRSSFFLSLRERLRAEPLSLEAALSGWDHLVLAFVQRYGSPDIPPGLPAPDSAVCVAAGVLLAGYPVDSMLSRAADLITLLLEKQNPALNPATVAMGPWTEWGSHALKIWARYPDWWKWQLGRIAAAAGGRLWQPEISASRKYWEIVAARTAADEIPESRLPKLFRHALVVT